MSLVDQITTLWRNLGSGGRYDRPVLPVFFDANGDPQFVSVTQNIPVVDESLQCLTLNPAKAIAIGAASVQSSVVEATTGRVILIPTVDCWVAIGANPTAVANAPSFFLPAKTPFYPVKVIGGVDKIAVIHDSVGGIGKLSIVEAL